MMEFCTRLEFPFSKNLESDRKRLQQENITLYWLSWSANLFSWKYNSHLPRPLSCSERKTVWLKISIIYIQRVTLTLTWLGTLAEVKWKWNMIVKREIRSFNDRLKQWNTVNNYENSLVALDNMQQNGLIRRIHDDFKATKVCNYANRTPLRFVHMYEHCFPLSHDFLRHVHCCRSAKRKKPVQLRMCRTFDAYVMNYTPWSR